MIKMSGAEWKRFYRDPVAWPEGCWHEDEEITVNGAPVGDDFNLATGAPDDAQMTVSGGVVYTEYEDAKEGPSVESHFRSWRKKQTTTTLIVEAPNALLDSIRAAIVAAGGKVR